MKWNIVAYKLVLLIRDCYLTFYVMYPVKCNHIENEYLVNEHNLNVNYNMLIVIVIFGEKDFHSLLKVYFFSVCKYSNMM